MIGRPRSILFKLILLTSVLLTVIFAGTGYLLERRTSAQATQTVESEVRASFRAYEALWREHTQSLQTVSRVISSTANVRAAFLTRDPATIRDSAGEIWANLSTSDSVFAIADGTGTVIVNLNQPSPFQLNQTLGFLAPSPDGAIARTGFLMQSQRLYQVVVTPVFVDATRGAGLLNILLTGFELNGPFLHSLKQASGGSDLIFKLRGVAVASTLESRAQMVDLGSRCSIQAIDRGALRLEAGGTSYLALERSLPGLLPGDSCQLCIVRSLAHTENAIGDLRHQITYFWLTGLVAAILAVYALVRRMMQPVAELDRAATEIASGNLRTRVAIHSDDELGRLAATFNSMSASLESAQTQLIQQERLSAVARLATFVVHDLRNPIASIYAGAEMLVDNDDLPPKQIKRLAHNMYQASRGVMQILQNLLATTRQKSEPLETCLIGDLVHTAWQGLASRPATGAIEFDPHRIPEDLQLTLDRAPMERVFHNLFENAVTAMNGKGRITVWTDRIEQAVLIHIQDSGPGIHPDLRPVLFQPFATNGHSEGLGLGLALSRQTVAAHGGDLWADFACTHGSHFVIRLPNR